MEQKGGEGVLATKRRSLQQAAADNKHAVRISLKFNKIFDYEILQWLEQQPNKQGAIKEALQWYISSEQ